ncbi:hypothetical protein P3L10_004802 [Capsicum annuum]
MMLRVSLCWMHRQIRLGERTAILFNGHIWSHYSLCTTGFHWDFYIGCWKRSSDGSKLWKQAMKQKIKRTFSVGGDEVNCELFCYA